MKSHLQKYRIHQQRSKEEFHLFFEQYLRDSYEYWLAHHGWEYNLCEIPAHSSKQNLSITGGSSGGAAHHAIINSAAVSQQQERVSKKLKQLHELQELLKQSSTMLHEWQEIGREIVGRTGMSYIRAFITLLNKSPLISIFLCITGDLQHDLSSLLQHYANDESMERLVNSIPEMNSQPQHLSLASVSMHPTNTRKR